MTSQTTDDSRRARRLLVAWVQILFVLLSLALAWPCEALGAVQEASAELAATAETSVYARTHGAVVRVTHGLYGGSGFFVDTLGRVVLTLAFAPWNDGPISVTVAGRRYPAQLLSRDTVAGVTVLRVAPSVCTDCPRLKLAAADSGSPLIAPGDSVYALGYPVKPGDSLATGAVICTDQLMICSSVNLNQGNAGGPLLNHLGEVVGLNSYMESKDGKNHGYASLLMKPMGGALAQAKESLATATVPDSTALPVLPPGRFSELGVQQLAGAADWDEYDDLAWNEAGMYFVTFISPVIRAMRQRYYDVVFAKDGRKEKTTRKLELAAEGVRRGRSQVAMLVGDTLAPAVSVMVIPVALLQDRGFLLPNGKFDLKYQSDLDRVTIWRDSSIVVPVEGGLVTVRDKVDTTRTKVIGGSHAGFFVFDPRVFEPDRDGRVPRIQLVLEDSKNPDYRRCITLQRRQVARIWNDFEPYFLEYPDEVPYVRANPSLAQRMMGDLPSSMTGCPETKSAFPGTGR